MCMFCGGVVEATLLAIGLGALAKVWRKWRQRRAERMNAQKGADHVVGTSHG